MSSFDIIFHYMIFTQEKAAEEFAGSRVDDGEEMRL